MYVSVQCEYMLDIQHCVSNDALYTYTMHYVLYCLVYEFEKRKSSHCTLNVIVTCFAQHDLNHHHTEDE